jgi:hypothetical protein
MSGKPARNKKEEKDLVNLDAIIDLSNKGHGRKEPNGARKDKEHQTHDRCPSKVEHHRRKALDLQSRKIVHDRVQENVHCRRPRGQKGSPPPMVILSTQMEITHQDRHLGTGQDQYAKDQEKEPKDVVDLVEPDRVQDEIQLDKDRAKGQDTAYHH